MACPFWFLSHSVAVVVWSGIQRVDPQMNRLELFYHPVHRSQFNPQTIFVSLGGWKKNMLDIHRKKIIILIPFHSKAFVLLYKFETSWALLGRRSRSCVFFAISGANFTHSLFMILSGLGLLFMWELPCRVSYFWKLLSLKSTLAPLFRIFGLPLRFLPSKHSFLHDHFTTNIRIHPDF